MKTTVILGVLLFAPPAWSMNFGCDPRFGWDSYNLCRQQEAEYNARAIREAWMQRDTEIETLHQRVDELERAQQKPEDTPENRSLIRELEEEAHRHGY